VNQDADHQRNEGGQIVHVNALHDDDDRSRALIVETRDQRVRENWLAAFRLTSDIASSGFSGSSMTMM
jgi:hypothetical protein